MCKAGGTEQGLWKPSEKEAEAEKLLTRLAMRALYLLLAASAKGKEPRNVLMSCATAGDYHVSHVCRSYSSTHNSAEQS